MSPNDPNHPADYTDPTGHTDPAGHTDLDGRFGAWGESLPTGPAPLAAITRGARTRRRRRTMLVGAAAAVALVAAAGGLALTRPDDSGPGLRAAEQPSTAPADRPVTRGQHGIGVDVPEGWGLNAVECNGTPRRTTVLVDDGGVQCAMLSSWPLNVQQVAFTKGAGPAPGSTSTREVGAFTAQVGPLECPTSEQSDGLARVCTQSLWFPEVSMLLTAGSSHVDEATARRQVTTMLEHVHPLAADEIAIPDPAPVANEHQEKGAEVYDGLAREAGLVVETRTKKGSGAPSGSLLGVTPEAGTVVAPGSTVTLVVAR